MSWQGLVVGFYIGLIGGFIVSAFLISAMRSSRAVQSIGRRGNYKVTFNGKEI
jgi:hypothetical protein